MEMEGGRRRAGNGAGRGVSRGHGMEQEEGRPRAGNEAKRELVEGRK